jgi:uncharacterized protein YjbJ (UPF0337 family)
MPYGSVGIPMGVDRSWSGDTSLRVLRAAYGVEQRKGKPVGRKGGGRDRCDGAMNEARGRITEAAGALTGDETKGYEGRSEQSRGAAKEKKGGLKGFLK